MGNSNFRTDFCSTKNVDYFKNLCKELAQFHEITGQLKILVSRQCLPQKVSLFSTAKQDDETITENLLLCKYNKMAKMLEDEHDIHNETDKIQYSELIALGRGKNEHDIMEYKLYKKDTYMPYENLIDFLKKVKTGDTMDVTPRTREVTWADKHPRRRVNTFRNSLFGFVSAAATRGEFCISLNCS